MSQFEPVTYQSNGGTGDLSSFAALVNQLGGSSRLRGAYQSQTNDPSLKTLWFRWIPLYSGSFYAVAENEGTTLISPNIAVYRWHDPTQLVGLIRGTGTNGSCTLSASGISGLTAGGLYTVCFDRMLEGRSAFRWNQDDAVLAAMPSPTFSISGQIMTINVGGGAPNTTQLQYRVKPTTELQSPWINYFEPVKLMQAAYTLQARATSVGYLPSSLVEQAVDITP